MAGVSAQQRHLVRTFVGCSCHFADNKTGLNVPGIVFLALVFLTDVLLWKGVFICVWGLLDPLQPVQFQEHRDVPVYYNSPMIISWTVTK